MPRNSLSFWSEAHENSGEDPGCWTHVISIPTRQREWSTLNVPSTLVGQFSVVTTHITILLLFKVGSSVSFPALSNDTHWCACCTDNFAWGCSLTVCRSALLKWKLRIGWSLSWHIKSHIDVMIFRKPHVAQQGMTPWLRSFDLNRKLPIKSSLRCCGSKPCFGSWVKFLGLPFFSSQTLREF